jgi:hypothetical protein
MIEKHLRPPLSPAFEAGLYLICEYSHAQRINILPSEDKSVIDSVFGSTFRYGKIRWVNRLLRVLSASFRNSLMGGKSALA